MYGSLICGGDSYFVTKWRDSGAYVYRFLPGLEDLFYDKFRTFSSRRVKR